MLGRSVPRSSSGWARSTRTCTRRSQTSGPGSASTAIRRIFRCLLCGGRRRADRRLIRIARGSGDASQVFEVSSVRASSLALTSERGQSGVALGSGIERSSHSQMGNASVVRSSRAGDSLSGAACERRSDASASRACSLASRRACSWVASIRLVLGGESGLLCGFASRPFFGGLASGSFPGGRSGLLFGLA